MKEVSTALECGSRQRRLGSGKTTRLGASQEAIDIILIQYLSVSAYRKLSCRVAAHLCTTASVTRVCTCKGDASAGE